MSAHRFSGRRLYGLDGDDSLCSDLGEFIDDLWDDHESGDEVEILEYTVLPPGDYGGEGIPDPELILSLVLDRAADSCGSLEDLGDWLHGLDGDVHLLNCCRSLVAMINNQQTYMVADQIVDRHLFRWDGDNWVKVAS